ncbi:MAG: O-antigen ligase family protein [bacterium]|nr:O-antigen ligase family protein [bacterium]
MIDLRGERLDRLVLLGLQGLVVVVPLLLGGVHERTLQLACPIVLALLAATVWRRWQLGTTDGAPGVAALAAFVLLGVLTTLPLPPLVLGWLAPGAEALFRANLPGWPDAGGWAAWRATALEPFAVSVELLRFAIGFGTFAVIVAYPWSETAHGEPGRTRTFRVLFLTLAATALGLAVVAFAQEAVGNEQVLWVMPAERARARQAGPFVNPNHFAAWLEMVLPALVAYACAVERRVRRRVLDAVDSGRGVGVQARRAWAAALIANQGRLWPPMAAIAVVVVVLAAHLATDSRGGRAALLSGLAVVGVGVLAQRGPKRLRAPVRRAAPLLVAGLVVASVGSFVVLGFGGDETGAEAVLEQADVGLGERLAVGVQGLGVVAEHPIVGAGLGSWMHAYRPFQAPPVEDGIWDHAHDDYLELAAETGVAGVLVALVFAVAVTRAFRRRATPPGERRRRRDVPRFDDPFADADWLAALGDVSLLRWGLVGGVVAILVHSFVDFGLRMPANLLLLMVVLGLLVLSVPPRPAPRMVLAPAALLATLLLAAIPVVREDWRGLTGDAPRSVDGALEAVDDLSLEDDDAATLAMARRALELSPASREVHEAFAEVVGPGADGDAALRRAVALEPWAPEVRDRLGLQLWAQGKRAEALAELEESMFRYPHLDTHAYLDPESDFFPPANAEQLRKELIEGETVSARLAQLDPDMTAAVERGLQRALAEHPGGSDRTAVMQNVITLLEARQRWREAAEALRGQAAQRLDDTEALARAARNFLKVDDYAAAEETLLTAITRSPEEGGLYRKLAVDVYARRGDFDLADTILEAGERNAVDLTPVYRGVTDVLTQREIARPSPTGASDLHDDPLLIGEGDAEELDAE